MENASKALIIAGAILLSILIIALGVFIFNMARSSIDTNALDSVTISTFNEPLTQYEGKTVGTSVKSLLSNVITNCATNAGSAEKLPDVYYYDARGIGPKMSTVTGSTGVTSSDTEVEIVSNVSETNKAALTKLRTLISNTHYYYVSVEYNVQGLVACVHIGYSDGDQDTEVHSDTDWYGTTTP